MPVVVSRGIKTEISVTNVVSKEKHSLNLAVNDGGKNKLITNISAEGERVKVSFIVIVAKY